MPSDRDRSIERLYHLALEQPAADRAAFLERAGGDEIVRREVESLLAFADSAERFMETPVAEQAASVLLGHEATDAPAATAQGRVPERICHYRIIRKLGEGGMGTVYAAEDERLGRQVALKTFRADSFQPDAARRLWREARALAAINHQNVCRIYDVAGQAEDLFIVMELLEGESLAQRIARGPLAVPDAIQMTLEILRGLGELHRRGLVHRDLKPSNVLLTSHGATLIDFGLTRRTHGAVAFDGPRQDPITQTGALPGTPQYMAPEQIQGDVVDLRADLFALGAMLFQMLTCRLAFTGRTTVDVLHTIVHEQPPALGGSAAITAVDRIIRRAVEKKPVNRYQTAGDMADALRTALLVRDASAPVRGRPITRLIVLPFHAPQEDERIEFLAFSLPEAITARLAALESVILRSSAVASQFAGQPVDVGRIASECDVDVILTGTLLRVEEELQASVQLADVSHRGVIWSHSMRSRLRDVFELQEQLVRGIVASLALPLSVRDQQMLERDVPGNATAYEFYLRANQLSYDWHHQHLARDLYLKSVEHDPAFAPAWARLGRCCLMIGKLDGDAAHLTQAEAAFERALDLNSDLALAHNLYARMEADQGRATTAMVRLLERAQSNRTDPELFSSLVYACRYCGLLEASAAAHREVRRLDSHVRTSVSRTFYLLGDYQRALEANVGDADVEGLALFALGREVEAVERLAEEEAKDTHLPKMRFMLASLRALIQGREDESRDWLSKIAAAFGGPEGRYLLSREWARAGEPARGLSMLAEAVDGGFFCYPGLVRDPWLDRLRGRPEFGQILRKAEERWRHAARAFVQAGGDEILGTGFPYR